MTACPHRIGSTCAAATEATGTHVIVTDPVCRLTCPKYGGPAGGGPLPDDGGKWAHAMLRYAWGTSLAKVADRYARPFDVWVPDAIAAEVRSAYAAVAARPWCDGLGLTGSVLSRRADHRDVDVVLLVNDVRAYLGERAGLALPTTIAGLKVDTFVRTRRAGWFLLLDLADLKLYRSGAYNLASVDPRITVVDAGDAYPAFRVPTAAPSPPPAPMPLTAGRVARGAVGLVKAVAGSPASPGWQPGQGAAMWAELHTKAAPDGAWLDGFAARVPCGACRGHFRAYVADDPPPLGDPAGWFAWTVGAHNAVNERRGVACWTVGQARARWGCGPGVSGAFA